MDGDAARTLWETALALAAEAATRKPLPPLLFLTDPRRTPDPVAIAARLPAGAGVIYRHFGEVDAPAIARRLRAVTTERRVTLIIGKDVDLAEEAGADGVHLPEAELGAASDIRRRRPAWLVTAAAHGPEAIARAEAQGVDAVLVSSVFASESPSAGTPLGVDGFAALASHTTLPVYALGGVAAGNAAQLKGSGAAGIAAIDGIVQAWSAHEKGR